MTDIAETAAPPLRTDAPTHRPQETGGAAVKTHYLRLKLPRDVRFSSELESIVYEKATADRLLTSFELQQRVHAYLVDHPGLKLNFTPRQLEGIIQGLVDKRALQEVNGVRLERFLESCR